MTRLAEKINLSIIGLFLVGLLVGGLAVGLVDVKRPKPLFSSADGGGTILEDCQDQVDALTDFVESINNMEHPIEHSQWLEYRNQNDTLENNVRDCALDVGDAFSEEWMPEYNRLNEELTQAIEDRDVAGSYFGETSAEARALYDTWLDECYTSQGGRGTNQNMTATGKLPDPASLLDTASKQNSTLSKDNNINSDECNDLFQEYRAAYLEAQQAFAEYLEIAQEVSRLEEQIHRMDYEWNNFQLDRNFTFEIGVHTDIRDEYGNPPLPAYSSGNGSGSGSSTRAY